MRLSCPVLLANLARVARRKATATDPAKLRRLSMPPQPFRALHHAPSFYSGALGLPIGHSMIVGSVLSCCSPGSTSAPPPTDTEWAIQRLRAVAIPLFILAANLVNIGSLTDGYSSFLLSLVGRFRGGLGLVNIVANMIFAGMSGSASPTRSVFRHIIIGMMTKDGRYTVAYAGAITASAAIIGPIFRHRSRWFSTR